MLVLVLVLVSIVNFSRHHPRHHPRHHHRPRHHPRHRRHPRHHRHRQTLDNVAEESPSETAMMKGDDDVIAVSHFHIRRHWLVKLLPVLSSS